MIDVKPGLKLRCVDTQGYSQYTINHIYTVSKADSHYFGLSEVDRGRLDRDLCRIRGHKKFNKQDHMFDVVVKPTVLILQDE